MGKVRTTPSPGFQARCTRKNCPARTPSTAWPFTLTDARSAQAGIRSRRGNSTGRSGASLSRTSPRNGYSVSSVIASRVSPATVVRTSLGA